MAPFVVLLLLLKPGVRQVTGFYCGALCCLLHLFAVPKSTLLFQMKGLLIVLVVGGTIWSLSSTAVDKEAC